MRASERSGERHKEWTARVGRSRTRGEAARREKERRGAGRCFVKETRPRRGGNAREANSAQATSNNSNTINQYNTQNSYISALQLIECQDYVVKLENQVEDCTNPERIRLLDGPEESVDELMQKLEKVFSITILIHLNPR